jgi:hypothetical protein
MYIYVRILGVCVYECVFLTDTNIPSHFNVYNAWSDDGI